MKDVYIQMESFKFTQEIHADYVIEYEKNILFLNFGAYL